MRTNNTSEEQTSSDLPSKKGRKIVCVYLDTDEYRQFQLLCSREKTTVSARLRYLIARDLGSQDALSEERRVK